MSQTAYIALGANLGDRLATLNRAIARIAAIPGVAIAARSAVIETQPIGGPPDQPPYLNAAIAVATSLSPRELLDRLAAIETEFGRQRTTHWGPRTIDLDLLMVDSQIINSPDLIIPHPRLHLRRFVLQPLAEIAPNVLHPLLNKTIQTLLKELESIDRKSVV